MDEPGTVLTDRYTQITFKRKDFDDKYISQSPQGFFGYPGGQPMQDLTIENRKDSVITFQVETDSSFKPTQKFFLRDDLRLGVVFKLTLA